MPKVRACWLLCCGFAACTTPRPDGMPPATAPVSLRAYHAAFAAAVGTRAAGTATMDEFVALLRRSRVLWLGDHHGDASLHRRHRSLLRRLQDDGVRVCLALEAIGTQDQAAVDDLLAGRLGVDALARRIRTRWEQSWLDDPGVDAEHWRSLLAWAQSTRTPVVALEPTPRVPLEERDSLIAANVSAAAARYRDRLLVVCIGQSHLLGVGDLARRCALPGIVVGAVPPRPLLGRSTPGEGLVRSDGGVWFFADSLLR